MKRIASFLTVITVGSLGAVAEGAGVLAERSDSVGTFSTKEVVVTGSPLSTTRDRSLHRVRVMDSSRISSQQAVSLRDILITELNIDVQQDAVLGGSASIQGIGGNGVKLLIDGIPIVGRMNGNIDISQVLLANAERVEIVEGPMAVMYGSDAIGGVINVVSRNNETESIRGMAHAYTESVGTYNLNLGLRGAVENVSYSIQGARNLFDGWTADVTANRSAQWKPREQYMVDVRVSPSWGNVSLDYDMRFFDETILNRGEPRAPYGETAFDDAYLTTRFVHAATARWSNNNNIAAHGTVSYTHYRREKLSTIKNLVTLATTPLTADGAQDTTTIGTFMTRLVSNIGSDTNTISVTTGLEATHESMNSGRLASSTTAMADVGVFAETRFVPTRAFTVQVAGRGMWNSSFGLYGVPSVHAVWKAGHSSTLRASVAQGYRAPSLRETHLFFVDVNHDIVGNPNIKPEQSTALNTSASILFTSSEHAIRIEPSAYYNDVRDLITLAQTENTQQYSYVNVGRMVTYGVQAELTYSINSFDGTIGGVLAAASSSMVGNALSTPMVTPQAKVTIRWSLPVWDLALSTYMKHTGAQQRPVRVSNDELVNQRADPFTMLDMTIGRRFFEKTLSISVGCKNMFDVTNVAISTAGGAHSNGSSQPIGMGRMFTMDVAVHLP